MQMGYQWVNWITFIVYHVRSRQRKSYASQGSYDGSEMQVTGGRRHFAYHTTDGDNYPDDGGKLGIFSISFQN